MPCRDDGPLYEAPWQDVGRKVHELLKEAKGYKNFNHESPADYDCPNRKTLDGLTASLCAILKGKTAAEISRFSLDLQIWWRDHQRADARRLAAEEAAKRVAQLRKSGLAKLTKEERKALNLLRRSNP